MQTPIYLLWDDAHIWGHMALRALDALGLCRRVIKARDIAHGALSCKPPLLLVPGGTARLKARALGTAGCEAIRAYVAEGGVYLGFCGGAGLGLSGDNGLHLCPWKRATYSNRTQHLTSGHIICATRAHPLSLIQGEAPLPVWWPGRFAPQADESVTVLASYQCAHTDLCLADIPLASLPADTLGTWRAVYGVDMGLAFMTGQPCVITGVYGQGRYVLSYSHLETPDSPAANAWFVHLLHTLAHIQPAKNSLPPWDVAAQPVLWPRKAAFAPLHEAREGLLRLMDLGVAHNLLFRRTPWLYGWRAGIPGAALNNLHAALCVACAQTPTPRALAYWHTQCSAFARAVPLFLQGVEGYLLAERLATTLPDTVDRRGLRCQREALFGLPMEGGGLYQELVTIADELVYYTIGNL